MSAYNARMVASVEQTTFMRVVAAETPGHLSYSLDNCIYRTHLTMGMTILRRR